MLENLLLGLVTGMVESTARNALSTGDNPNIPFPTFGGPVGWNTLAECNGWRLQQNMFTNHARILDPYNVRHAWGEVNVMRSKFAEMARCGFGGAGSFERW